ncbi:sulfotransferase ssu-1-like [Ixodes scapularis]|uniref:sulfotransferase ssu-1-like n=1 Tax=Ixodes scapularis TaxID=6945 RepID=UPI001A9FFC9E|nr:sulfotransferase ssu-1-like [Ixodes scapularis]
MSLRCFPIYQDIGGVKYSMGYKAHHVREALNYMPHDGDIVMVSHLKCGNNWLEQIIQLILYGGQSAGDLSEYHRRTPYIEMVGTGPVQNMQPPRFFKTHFSYERQPMNPKAKYVYLTRNPLDVCVSFYHFTRSLPVYRFGDGTFDDFFELFVTGQNDRGDFFDHLMSWYSHKDDANVFFVTYEELKRNFNDTVSRLARFLGEEYARPLETDEELFQKVVDHSSIKFLSQLLTITEGKMKTMEEKGDNDVLDAAKRFVCNKSGKPSPLKIFVRKGIVGDWKTHFGEKHLDRLRSRIQEKKAVAVVKALWGSEDLGGVV